MKSLVLLFVANLIFTNPLFAQAPDTMWTKTYGGANREIGHSVYQTNDGGYIIAGITESFGNGSEDLYLIKTDVNGDTLWTRSYGGTDSDWGRAVQQTSDNGYIIAGNTSSFGHGNDDFYLIKTNSNGDTLWTKTYGGIERDRGASVQQTSDGGYIIAGITESFGNGDLDAYLIKTDSNGDTLWTKTYGGTDRDISHSVQQTLDNGYIAVGYTSSFGSGLRDVYLIKTDSNGDALWTKTYGGTDLEMGLSVNQTSDGGYIISGVTFMYGISTDYNFYLIKTDVNGDTLWTRSYGGMIVDIGFSVKQTSDGGYIVAGTTTDDLQGGWGSSDANDIYIVRTDSNGDTLWTKTLGGIYHDGVGEPSSVMQQTSDNGFIIVGSTNSFGTGDIDAWLIKLEPDSPSVIKNYDNLIPSYYYISQNYPNPFNPTTTIKFQIPELSFVTIKVFDVLGRKVTTLVNEEKPAGSYEVEFNATGLPGGVYFYRLQASDFVETKKMVLLK